MDYGVCIFATDYAMRIDDLAREAEQRGFESLWVPEHTHIPASRRSPFAGGAQLPKEYWHTLDPFVALTAAAAAMAAGRHGHLPDHRARHDHDRQGSREPRPALRRPLPLRHRRGLERGGDGRPRHRVQDALPEDARAGAGHEGDLDEGGTDARRLRQLRSDVVVSEARAAESARPPAARAATRSSASSTSARGGSARAQLPGRVRRPCRPAVRADKAGRDMKTISVSVFGAAPIAPCSTASRGPA